MANKLLKLFYSMIVLLCVGLVYGWSIFVAPLENEFGWLRSETSLTFTISMCALCLGLMVGGQINKKSNKPVLTLCLAGALILVGFFITSNAELLIQFYIFYGAFSGFGTGLAYVEIISIGSRMIPGKQGLVSGVLMMCFGLGGLVFGTICSAAMAAVGWRSVFRVIGLVFGVIVTIEGLVLRTETKQKQTEVNTEELEGLTTFNMIRRKDFIIIYMWLILLSASGLAIMGHIASCSLDMGASISLAALITGLVTMCNGLGRVLYGFIFDRLSVEITVLLINLTFVIASLLLAVAVMIDNMVFMVAGSVLIGISFGGAPSASSVIVLKKYGEKYFSSNFGAVSTQVMVAAIIGPYIAGQMYTHMGTYDTTFYMMSVFSILDMILAGAFIKALKAQKTQ